MKLFGGAVAWRVKKQATVTTLSTEAEILAISKTVKEAIYLSRLMQALNFVIPEALNLVIPEAFRIECENAQSI